MTGGGPQVPTFDVCGDLPTGTTVLEASAGTGKTYTIAALAARYVAEGRAELGELLLVTFGRMATNELRMRVRDRLVNVERALGVALSGQPADAEADPLERLLTTGTAAELAARHARTSRALSDFDAATIATTHEFCSRMLDELGVLGNRDPGVTFVEQVSELTREVASDVYLRRYANSELVPPMDYVTALSLAEEAVQAGYARLVPSPAAGKAEAGTLVPPVTVPGAERVAFAAEVRHEVQRRKERGRLFTYDDMLTSLATVLADESLGQAAANRLRGRYRIVLVDEFQDTDPVQWDILRRAFHNHSTLVLIGDPKQAVYAFRGADVFSYLDAVEEAGTVSTLATNWRSDRALTDALAVLLGAAALGDPRIVVRPVQARHLERRVWLPPDAPDHPGPVAPVRIRIVPYDPELERMPHVGDLRPLIAADLVADITGLLDSAVRVGGPPEAGGVAHGVSPADIAVIVRKNERGEAIREALVEAGVPAVLLGGSSVYGSPMAVEWLTLLQSLEQPRAALVKRASLTCFVGWTFGQLAAADEEQLAALTQQLRWWGRMLRTRGVAALMEVVATDTRLAERMLEHVGGERELTDLRHIGQSLHAVMASRQLGVSALLAWLREQLQAARETAAPDGLRRLETDVDAVQILTVHRSKGLEFPIVYLPEAWDRFVGGRDEGRTLRFHEQSSCVLDVGGVLAPGRADRFSQHLKEESGEELRLLYVALTRAKSQVVTWWAPSRNTESSALQRLLSGPRLEGVEPAQTYQVSADPLTCGHLGSGFSLERVEPRDPAVWRSPLEPAASLDVRTFRRQLDLEWRRTSYSALTAAVHGLDLAEAGVSSEPEPGKEDDESAATGVVVLGTSGQPTAPRADPAVADPAVADPALERLSPMADLPSGAEFGTVVHAVLERIDPHSSNLMAELRSACAEQLGRAPATTLTVSGLAEGLVQTLLTPLGPSTQNVRLCDVEPRDRLTELSFEMPLGGGDSAAPTDAVPPTIRLGDLSPLLRRQVPADDPLASYADLISHPLLAAQTLRGYLTGSIDAVLRLRTADGSTRFVVVDYKTNWLGGFDSGPLTLGRYTPPMLAKAMMQAHYPLQALLYSVAVHRFLRWRQPDYDPETHLGGVLYLFLRGMAGADTPVVDGAPCGVFSWRPPAALVTELSDLLDAGASSPAANRGVPE